MIRQNFIDATIKFPHFLQRKTSNGDYIRDGALIQFSMPRVSFVCLLMYYVDLPT
jgi:hypothetical protein